VDNVRTCNIQTMKQEHVLISLHIP